MDGKWVLTYLDQGRRHGVKEGLVPFVDHLGALAGAAAWPNSEVDASVVEGNKGLGFPVGDGEQVAAAPKVVALALDELARRFARLALQLSLLLPNPAEPGDGIGAGGIQTCRGGGGQGDAAAGRVAFSTGTPLSPSRLATP
jgi:hypothetical protein